MSEGEEPIGKQKRGAQENFNQQNLKAWQPVLTSKTTTAVFYFFGIIFAVVGCLMLVTSLSLVECQLEYHDPPRGCAEFGNQECDVGMFVTLRAENCIGALGDDGKLTQPLFFYYGLTNYYQSHRRYVKSRSDAQLSGEVITDGSDLSECDPLVHFQDGRIRSPCGLIAWSVFNDTFRLHAGESPAQRQINWDESASAIAWKADGRKRFKNPSDTDPRIHEWLNEEIFPGKVENAHFIVWMRVAALPNFRKLYAKVLEDVQLPVTVAIQSRYPTAGYGGQKSVILAQVGWLGGRNLVLGIAYIVVGFISIICGVFFTVQVFRHPRVFGDVRYLNWRKGKHA